MIITIGKKFKFDAAHFLPEHAGLCKIMHGHTYTMTIELKGEVNQSLGMVLDFYELSRVVKEVLEGYDHSLLNDRFKNPTVEILTIAFTRQFALYYPRCQVTIQLQEGDGGYARHTEGGSLL